MKLRISVGAKWAIQSGSKGIAYELLLHRIRHTKDTKTAVILAGQQHIFSNPEAPHLLPNSQFKLL